MTGSRWLEGRLLSLPLSSCIVGDDGGGGGDNDSVRSGARGGERDALDPARSVSASHPDSDSAKQQQSNRHIRPAICLSGLVPKFLVAARGWWAWRRPATAVRGTYVCVRMCACRFGQSQSRWPHQVQGQGEQQSSRVARNSNIRPTRLGHIRPDTRFAGQYLDWRLSDWMDWPTALI